MLHLCHERISSFTNLLGVIDGVARYPKIDGSAGVVELIRLALGALESEACGILSRKGVEKYIALVAAVYYYDVNVINLFLKSPSFCSRSRLGHAIAVYCAKSLSGDVACESRRTSVVHDAASLSLGTGESFDLSNAACTSVLHLVSTLYSSNTAIMAEGMFYVSTRSRIFRQSHTD